MSAVIEKTLPGIYAEYGRNLIVELADDEDPEVLFAHICEQLENANIEQDADGNVEIMSPVGGESSSQNAELTMQLQIWSKRDGRGRAFDSSVLFRLPDGSKRGPDGSWVHRETLATLPPEERDKFLKLVPDFVIELKSPTDRYSKLHEKMQNWIRNGVQLGWLIDPRKQTVAVYRGTSTEPEMRSGDNIAGDGPVEGFILDLKPIWDGLKEI